MVHLTSITLISSILSIAWAFPNYQRDTPSEGKVITFPAPANDTSSKLIPDAAHPYQAPGPGDLRGPCPGLNTLANHGYLPRSGVMSAEDLINGAQEGFNLDYDFAVAVTAFALLTRGNAYLDLVSIGGESSSIPPLPGAIDGTPGGLSKHGRFEGDVSMTRADAALGDNADFQPDMFANLLTYVDRFGDGDNVTLKVFQEYRFDRYWDSRDRNDEMQFHVGRHGFGYGEAGFILNLFPSAKKGNLTVSEMSSFFVDEKFPPAWFRHDGPFTFADVGQAANAVQEPHPTDPGGKVDNGTFVSDETDPNLSGPCGLYYNLVGQNIAGVLVNTTGVLKQNVDTLLDGIHKLFADGCSPITPFGPAGV